jgi:hypothetical protein
MEKARAGEGRDSSGERHGHVPAGGEWWEKESGRFRTRLSNFAYYAVTGVKAQAFVRVLFLCMRGVEEI